MKKTQHNYIDFDIWAEEYKPVKNHIDKNASYDGCMFETYGAENDYITMMAQKDPLRVWTILDIDGFLNVGDGWHYVNRFGYLITEKPAEPGKSYDIYDYDDIKKLLRRESRERAKQKKEGFIVYSSNGEIFARLDGWVIDCKMIKGGEGIDNIKSFDVKEFETYHGRKIAKGERLDILDFGYWLEDKTYEEPAEDWRKMIIEMKEENNK